MQAKLLTIFNEAAKNMFLGCPTTKKYIGCLDRHRLDLPKVVELKSYPDIRSAPRQYSRTVAMTKVVLKERNVNLFMEKTIEKARLRSLSCIL